MFVELVPSEVISDWSQFNMVFCASDVRQVGRGDMWAIKLTASASASSFVVTRSSRDHHVIVWTSQSSAEVPLLSLCVHLKLILADHDDRKMSMLPDLNTGVRGTKRASRS